SDRKDHLFEKIKQANSGLAKIYEVHCIDDQATNDHPAKYKGRYLIDPNTKYESEIKFREIAENFQFMMQNPEEYMKWFTRGKMYGSYLSGECDIDVDEETFRHVESNESKEPKNPEYHLRQATLEFGAYTALDRQLHLKDLEHV